MTRSPWGFRHKPREKRDRGQQHQIHFIDSVKTETYEYLENRAFASLCFIFVFRLHFPRVDPTRGNRHRDRRLGPIRLVVSLALGTRQNAVPGPLRHHLAVHVTGPLNGVPGKPYVEGTSAGGFTNWCGRQPSAASKRRWLV